ncbi:MAG: hypothetical protein HY747_12605 [Elusimicrobia bacterium]|nr:hypothetical protein [Elusimicrobiota bacterium]
MEDEGLDKKNPPPEEMLVEAERCIERIEKLFSDDPFEEIRLREPSLETVPAGRFQKIFRRIKAWRLPPKKRQSLYLALIGFSGLAVVAAYYLLAWPKKTWPRPGPAMTSGGQKSASTAPKEKAEPWGRSETEAAAAPLRSASGTELRPEAVAAPQSPIVSKPPASTAAAAKAPAPKLKSDANKEQALQEINFAEEVLATMRAAKSKETIALAESAIQKAKTMLDEGKSSEASRLARQTAEQLLVGE